MSSMFNTKYPTNLTQVWLWSRNQHLLTWRQNLSSRVRYRSHQSIVHSLYSLGHPQLASKLRKELFLLSSADSTLLSSSLKASKKYLKSMSIFVALQVALSQMPELSSSTQELKHWTIDTLTSNQSPWKLWLKQFLIWHWTLEKEIHHQRKSQCRVLMELHFWLPVWMKMVQQFTRQIHQEQWLNTRQRELVQLTREFSRYWMRNTTR